MAHHYPPALPLIPISTRPPRETSSPSFSRSDLTEVDLSCRPTRSDITRRQYHASSNNSRDRQDMQRMGKKQELRRNFRLISTIGFASCVLAPWEILLTTNASGLANGGMAGLFWSLVWTYIGQFFVVLSLAEMASMAPTAGGQYHWVSEFAPRSTQRSLSYCSGWLATISWQSLVAADAFIVAEIIEALVVLLRPTYVAERWHTTVLAIASISVISAFNILAASHLPLAEGIFAIYHVFAFVPIVVSLWTLSSHQAPADVFLKFADNGGDWPNLTLSILVGQVSNMFTVLGSDSVVHLAEEIEDAGVVVPKSMIWSYLLNMPLTFIMLVTYCFCISSVQEALEADFAFVYVFHTAFHHTGPTAWFVCVVLVLLAIVTASAQVSTSRQTFAFARDGGLPLRRWISRVSPRFKVPVNAILISAGFTITLSLINIGSAVAFNAIISLSTVALMATYLISLVCVTAKRARGESLPPCRWSLGQRKGLAVNIVASAYALWAFFWSFWPTTYRLNLDNFNWASVVFMGLMCFALIKYMTGARRVFHGPVTKTEELAR